MAIFARVFRYKGEATSYLSAFMADFVPPVPLGTPPACQEILPQQAVAVHHECVKRIAALVLSSTEYLDTWTHFFPRPIPPVEDLTLGQSERIWSEIRELAAKIRQTVSPSRAARLSDERLESQPEVVLKMFNHRYHQSFLEIGTVLGYNTFFPRERSLERRSQNLLAQMASYPHPSIRCVSKDVCQMLCFPRIALSPALIQLVVVGQGIRAFPSLHQCVLLQHLRLSGNELCDLPSGIRELPNLRTLDLSRNRLEEVSVQAGCWTALGALILEGNRLTRFPDISSCPALTQLDVSENAIQEIPEWIGRLQGLQEFRANRCGLEHLPEAMGSLPNLQIVELVYNKLRALPSPLRWPLVQTLDLSLNDFREVSAEVGQLPSLIHLDVSGNFYLLDLPSSFSHTLHTLVVDTSQKEVLEEDLSALTDAMVDLTIEVFGAEDHSKGSV